MMGNFESTSSWFARHREDQIGNSIFLRLTVELGGKYALVGILCLLRHVRWYVGN